MQVPGETLFPIEEAINKGTIIMNLLSDAAQSQTWPTIAPLITKGKTLYFSHGFSIVYKEDTKVIPPADVDVILVAPKGSGRTVRTLFKEGRGINSSVAVFQDVTGKAKERAIALGVGIGSGYMYDTTFEKEVYSDRSLKFFGELEEVLCKAEMQKVEIDKGTRGTNHRLVMSVR